MSGATPPHSGDLRRRPLERRAPRFARHGALLRCPQVMIAVRTRAERPPRRLYGALRGHAAALRRLRLVGCGGRALVAGGSIHRRCRLEPGRARSDRGDSTACLVARLRFAASLFEPFIDLCCRKSYGGTRRTLNMVLGTAVRYHNGLPPAIIRWALLHDPASPSAPCLGLARKPKNTKYNGQFGCYLRYPSVRSAVVFGAAFITCFIALAWEDTS